MSQLLLDVRSVDKSYRNHRALKSVDIRVPKGSIFGLLGPNGAGKTTLIRIINQITGPDNGTVLLDGESLQPNHIEDIGYLPEERGLYKKMKIGEQAMYLAQLKGLSNAEAKSALREWFKRFDIIDWWDKKVEELSKGMQQKVQFITTVLHEPKLLIFDEPFSGFDPINANLIKEEILRLRDKGATVIFSTHRMESVEELCDHISLINNGEVILSGALSEIKKEYSTNTFEVGYSAVSGSLKLNNAYEVVEDTGSMASIRIIDDRSPNQLIQELLPQSEIHTFKEKIPSVNDIFIQTVESAS
jgi:ABC-2 type transport system ATP-binding protein